MPTITLSHSMMRRIQEINGAIHHKNDLSDLLPCLLYTSPSPRDVEESRMPSSA